MLPYAIQVTFKSIFQTPMNTAMGLQKEAEESSPMETLKQDIFISVQSCTAQYGSHQPHDMELFEFLKSDQS